MLSKINYIDYVNAVCKNKNAIWLNIIKLNNITETFELKCNVCGTIWKPSVSSIKKGSWCPKCANDNKRTSINELRKTAAKFGGKCLEEDYKNDKIKILWECGKGHQWKSIYSNVKHKNRWCPKCAGNKKLNLDIIKNIAMRRGGECLSEEYINAATPLIWKCELDHIWKSNVNNIVSKNSWCPNCNNVGFKELICKIIFDEIFSNKFVKIKHKLILGVKNKPLELDGYCEELMIAFEHQGSQHYSFKFKNHDVKNLKENDEIKVRRCKDLGINLFIIPELFLMTKIKDLFNLIKDQANNFGITLINQSIEIDDVITKAMKEKYFKIKGNE